MSSSFPYHIKHQPSVNHAVSHGWMMIEEHGTQTSCTLPCSNANNTAGDASTKPQQLLRHTIYLLIIGLLILSGCHDQAQQLNKQEDTALQQVQIHLGDELTNSSNRYKGNYQDVINGGSVTLHYSFLSSDNTTIELQKDMFRFSSDWTVNLTLATGIYTFWANAYNSSGEKIFETDTSRTYTITAATQSLNLGLQLNPILEDITGIPTPIITQLTKPSGYFPGTPMEISYTAKGGAQDNLEVFVSVYNSTSHEIAGNSLGSPNAPVELNSTQDNITIYQDSIVVSIPADAKGSLRILFGVSSGLLQSGNYLEFTLDELFYSNELHVLRSIGELSLWLDASNVDGDYNSSLSDGDAVSVWKDLSGSGNDAQQTVSGDQPTYQSSAQNGKGGVVFDREGTQSGEYLIIDDSETLRFNADEFSVFYVVKKTIDENPGDGGNPGILLGSGRAGASGSEYKNMLHFLYDDHFDINIDDDTTWKGGETNGDFLGNYKIIYSERRNATTGSDTLNNYFDGLQESSFDIGVDYGTLTPNTPTPIHLGRKTYSLTSTTYSQYYLNGIVSEVIVFKKALADEERATVSSYLSSKWGLTSTVDSDGDGIVDASDPFPTDPSRWISFPEALRENIVNEFTPMQGLALWLDASNIDGNHNSGLNDGDSVSVWKDLSRNTNDLTQSSISNQPTIVSTSANPYLSFDGANDSLAVDASGHILDNPTGDDVTIFTVVKPKGGYYIFSTGGQSGSATGYALSYQGGNSFSIFKDNSAGKELSIADLFKTDSTQLVTHSYSGIYTDTKVQLNGAVTGEVVNHYNSSSNSYQLMTVGRPNNAHDYFGNFEIAEIIAIASDNPQKIIEIQNYLSNKWNLTSTVDSDGDGFVDTVDPEPTQSSLLAHYKFSGNANDSSGNNLDGVVHNSTLTADRFNNSDKAYSFDGSSYIEIPDDPILTNTTSLSISAWFKPVSSSGLMTILQKGSGDSDEEYVLAVTDQQVYFDVGASSGPYIQQSAAINAGEWNHVVATHLRTNGTSVLKVFVNGQDIGGSVNGSSLSPGDNNQSLKIGTRTGHGQHFEGQLDDIRIYGSVLSSEEVNLLYRENLTFTADSDGDGVMDADDPYPFRLPHRYWRVRTLEQKNVWNIKELQFYADTNLYDSTQNTIGVPSPTSIHNGANCIQSGQYGSHGCDRAFDNNLDSWWSNWAAGYESQTWIGMDFGSSPQDIKHVRIMAGRPAAGNREALVEWSDDKISWTEWTGNRIWIREKVDRQSADSRTNTWDEGVAQ